MKAQILQESFHEALKAVAWALPSKTLIASTNAILVTVGKGKVQVEATDLLTHATAYCPAAVEEDGISLLSGRQLLETVALMNQERIQLTSTDSKVTLRGSKSRASLNTMNIDDFPPQPNLSQASPVRNVQAGTLLSALHSVSFAAIRDPKQAAVTMLLGINLSFEQEVLTLIGCDSSRAAYSSAFSPGLSLPAITIPAGPFEAAIKVLSREPKTDIQITPDRTRVYLSVPSLASYSIQLLNGEYPNVRKLVPTNNPTLVTVDSKELADAIRFTQIYRGDSSAVRLSVTPNGIIASASEQAGEAVNRVEATLSGQLVSLAMNAAFVLDWLEMQTGKVEISFSDPAKPVLFRVPNAQPGDCYVCMPVYFKSSEILPAEGVVANA